MTVSPGHVIWAYVDHIHDAHCKGETPEQIRTWLRDQCHIHVSVRSIKDVLATYSGDDCG